MERERWRIPTLVCSVFGVVWGPPVSAQMNTQNRSCSTSPWPPKCDSSIPAGRATAGGRWEQRQGNSQGSVNSVFHLLSPPQGRTLSPELLLLPPALNLLLPWGEPRPILAGGNVPKTLGRDSGVPRAGMLLPSLLGTSGLAGHRWWPEGKEERERLSQLILQLHTASALPGNPGGLVLLP